MSFYKLKTPLLVLVFFVLGMGAAYWVNPDVAGKEEAAETLTHGKKKRAPHWANNRIDLVKVYQMGENNLRLKPIMDKLMRGELPRDWEAELNKILDTATRSEKSQALLVFFSLWAQTDIDAALARASMMGGVYTKEIKKEILMQLVENDPEEAARYYQKNKDNLLFDYDIMIIDIAQKWAKKSPDEAWEWCLSLDNPSSGSSPQWSALSAFMKGLDTTDSDLVKKYLDKFAQKDGTYPETIIQNWAAQNQEEALRWLHTAKDENHNYLRAAILGIAKNDLKKAEELLVGLPKEQQMGMIGDISRDMQKNQGAESALSWVMEKAPPAELEKSTYLLYPLMLWTNQSPGAAGQWIENLPASSVKDEAIIYYTGSLTDQTFYDKTFELINSMNSPEKKEATLKSTLQKWQNSNQDDFKKWIEKSSHSSEIKSLRQNTTPQ